MHSPTLIRVATANPDLLSQAQRYLIQREQGVRLSPELETAWGEFYEHYSHKIRKYAFTCGATEEDIADCVQDVWAELLLRLPAFRLDLNCGKFDTWLYHIVRGKAVNLRRGHQRDSSRKNQIILEAAIDSHRDPARTVEEKEIFAWAWGQVRKRLSDCNFQILRMRLLEERPVAEVAQELGLSHEQVWYRYHRARRQAEQIGSAWSRGQRAPPLPRRPVP